MSLTLGTRIGPYEVTAQIGMGGMGEVYRASDTKLKRQVALKILPAFFATDTDRLARFQREAEVLASLNHSNIAAIYGLEDSDGLKALVMELVEGPTLADRIAQGPISIDDALPIARQIAEALEAAHEQGIIHRDLKPANIKVRSDGTVKVLDFGLARASEPASALSPNLSQSPTITSPAMTQMGVILGTASYMSPEQAKGRGLDKRTDIFAFGCVLYEMLTGRRAFEGDDVGEILAGVIAREPDWARLPVEAPPRLHELLRRCLQKDPKKRWRDVGDLRAELDFVGEASVATRSSDQMTFVANRRRERALWVAAVLGTVIVTWLTTALLNRRGAHDGPIAAASDLVRFSMSPPKGVSLYAGGRIVPFAVSPDGRWLAFTAASDDGRSRLWVRPLGAEAAQSIPGTEGAVNPFWSPNSEWLGFNALNVLYRIRIPGGVPETITAFRNYTNGVADAAWGADVILYASSTGTIFRVSVQGGQPSQLTSLDSSTKERGHRWPQFLSDGTHFLYVAAGESSRVYVDSLAGGQRALLLDLPLGVSAVRFAPGYLFYVENMVLWAHPFDETSLHLTGERRRVVSGLPTGGAFSVSRTGVLAYWTQSLIQQATQLQWVDRKGNPQGLVGSPVVYDGFDLSRNGSKVVSAREGGDGLELWIHDLAAGGNGSFPLKFSMRGTVPVWRPDGKQLVFLFAGALYLADADKPNNAPVRLTDPSRNQLAQSWTSSGDQLVYEDWNADTGIDLAVVQMKDKSVVRLDLNTTSNEFGGRLSPNDRWLAYVTDQAGRPEVWVAAFPSSQPRRLVSAGSHPNWKGDGTELYFISTEGQLAVVPFASHGENIDVGTQTNLFRIPGIVQITAGSHNMYQAAHDGRRFLVAVKSEVANVPPISLIINWPQLLPGK